MANIQPITSGELGATTRSKMNQAIALANQVPTKAEQAAVDILSTRITDTFDKVDSTVNDLILAIGYDNRPADARILFTSSLTGSGKEQEPIDFGQVVTNADGTALRVTSTGGDPVVVASRIDQAVEPGIVYSARVAVRRHQNTSDPFGDAVQFGISCLNANKQKVSERIFAERALIVADGVLSMQVTFSRDQAADLIVSETTRYVRAFVRIFGGNGVTDVEVVGTWEGAGLPGPKGDTGSEPEYFLDLEREEIRWRQADGTLGPILDIGSARKKAEEARDIAAGYASDAFTKGEVQVVSTVQGLSGMTIGAGVTALRFNGYAAIGDNGGWPLAVEVANTGALLAWQRQSNGGTRRWELRALELTLEMFGGKANGTYSGINLAGTDNSPAFQAAQDYISVNPESIYLAGPTIRLGYGSYACYSTLKAKKNIRIVGAGGAGQGNANTASQLLFAQNTVGLWLMSNGSIDPSTGVASPNPSTGSVLENFTLRAAGGTDRTAHAVRAQTRFVAKGMRLQNFAGNGYHIQGSVEVSSNVNTWEIHGGRVTGCLNGIYAQGGDANAGAAYHVDTSSNLQCGILDNSFLGNYYFGCHENGNGTLSKVRYNGVLYFASQNGALFVDPSPLSTTPPGTNPAVWEPLSISDGGGYPTWMQGNEYYPSGQKVALNVNGRSVFIGGYSEGGYTPSLIGHPSALFGGFNASGVGGTGFIMSNNDLRGAKRLSGEVLEALLSGQADFEGLRVWNNTAGSRVVRTGLYVGTIDNDGINRRGAGRFSAIGYDNGNSELTWDYWNFAGKAFAKAFGFTSARALVPGTDNVSALGSASLRWSQLFAANATISTSDERAKQQIEEIPDEWLDAWADVQWCRFKFNDAVEIKGEEGARWHTGLIAQQVADVFVEHGIDPYSPGLVCYDEWDEEREPIFAQEPVLDEQGKDTGEMREVDTDETRIVREAGNLYGIRYEEAFAIEAAYQRRRMDRIEERLSAAAQKGMGGDLPSQDEL